MKPEQQMTHMATGTIQGKPDVKEKRLADIRIIEAWCKGCAICVEFCPKHVFVMKDSLPVVVDLNACNRCMLCEMRCPDFALTVR